MFLFFSPSQLAAANTDTDTRHGFFISFSSSCASSISYWVYQKACARRVVFCTVLKIVTQWLTLGFVLFYHYYIDQIIENPVTKNINKITVALCTALNEAFAPYESLSARHMGKQSENTMEMMGEMLCSVVKALVSMENFLRMQDGRSFFRTGE